MTVHVTQHAAQRFWKRHAPHLSERDARDALHAAAERATPIRERTRAGQLLLQVDEPRCLLVAKRDPGAAHILVIVTVLPRFSGSTGLDDCDVDDGVEELPAEFALQVKSANANRRRRRRRPRRAA